jgi:5-amino-6-(5-phospho-D-ribitylamino)uracil phosphatase
MYKNKVVVNMEKHLILLDLDGTLIKRDQTISEFNLDMLKKVRELGHEVIIVTGRAHYRSKWFYETLDLNTVFCNRNAGYIHHPLQEDFEVCLDTIDGAAIQSIMEHEMSQAFESIYFENKNNIYVIKGSKDYYLNNDFQAIQVMDEVDYKEVQDVNLISVSVLEESIEAVLKHIQSIDAIYIEKFRLPNGTYILQFYPKQTNKAKSIQWLSDYYQVPVERIIAMGDGGNDIEMIKTAGIGVAMANAIDQVKEVANVVMDQTNEESAVGYFLKDYFNLD